MVAPAVVGVAACVLHALFSLHGALAVNHSAHQHRRARAEFDGQRKLAPRILAQVGAHQTCLLPGFAAICGNFNGFDCIQTAKAHTFDLHHASGYGTLLWRGRVDP